jgi:hypothetical protein
MLKDVIEKSNLKKDLNKKKKAIKRIKIKFGTKIK